MNVFLLISLGVFTGSAQTDGGHDIAVTDAAIELEAPVDAGVEWATTYTSPLYSTCPVAPPVIVLDGGWTLTPPERNARIACLMTTCDVDRMRREKEMADSPPTSTWLVALGTAFSSALLTFSIIHSVKP